MAWPDGGWLWNTTMLVALLREKWDVWQIFRSTRESSEEINPPSPSVFAWSVETACAIHRSAQRTECIQHSCSARCPHSHSLLLNPGPGGFLSTRPGVLYPRREGLFPIGAYVGWGVFAAGRSEGRVVIAGAVNSCKSLGPRRLFLCANNNLPWQERLKSDFLCGRSRFQVCQICRLPQLIILQTPEDSSTLRWNSLWYENTDLIFFHAPATCNFSNPGGKEQETNILKIIFNQRWEAVHTVN